MFKKRFLARNIIIFFVVLSVWIITTGVLTINSQTGERYTRLHPKGHHLSTRDIGSDYAVTNTPGKGRKLINTGSKDLFVPLGKDSDWQSFLNAAPGLQVTVQNLAYCGDGVCGSGESSSNCCQDCGCSSGFNCINGNCKADCWYKKETIELQIFKEGDVLSRTGVYTDQDNPACYDFTNYTSTGQSPSPGQIEIPYGYESVKVIGITDKGDRCQSTRGKFHLQSFNPREHCHDPWPFGASWCPRYIYRTIKTDYIWRCVNDSCRPSSTNTSINGTINSSGTCIRDPYCGDGVCNSGENYYSCPRDCDAPGSGDCVPCTGDTRCLKGQRCIKGCCDGLKLIPEQQI